MAFTQIHLTCQIPRDTFEANVLNMLTAKLGHQMDDTFGDELQYSPVIWFSVILSHSHLIKKKPFRSKNKCNKTEKYQMTNREYRNNCLGVQKIASDELQ